MLDWAVAHSQDKDFVRKSPSEVALYLLARRSALATALELGQIRELIPAAARLALDMRRRPRDAG